MLLAKIASLAQSPLGANKVKNLAPVADARAVARRLRRLEELRRLMELGTLPSLEALEDMPPLISRLAVEGVLLSCEELLLVAAFLGSVGRAAAFLNQGGPELAETGRLGNAITPLPDIAARIRQVVGPGGAIKSSASGALGQIRGDLGKSRERLRTKLSAMAADPSLAANLSDQVVTQRADRFVLPVKTSAKGRLRGIIHDTSGSGATCFVEPLEAVEDNNRLSLLRRREKEEEERILRDLAAQLASQRQALGENLDALAKLDGLLAQAIFCQRLDAISPKLADGGRVDLIAARHPLLAWRALDGKRRAVPIQVRLSPEDRVLIISGANAGGKTVALKTVGLITLMTMCGLQSPLATGSAVSLSGQVFCEIGDDQSLETELSTFTAHAGRLAHISAQAGADSLVLIDELGGGTDPGEGAALGMAFLEGLMERGAAVLCTTHFHRLKAFAALTEGVKNVSVSFDQTTGQATYQLHYGEPGFSDALAVSQKLGFDPKVIARARELLDQGERQTIELLRQARQDRDQAAAELGRARAGLAEAEKAREEARGLLRAAKKERAGALAEGKRRVRQVAKRMEERLAELLARTQEAQEGGADPRPGALKQELYEVRRQGLSQVSQALDQGLDPALEPGMALPSGGLKAGDRVRVESMNQTAVVIEEPDPKAGTVMVALGQKGMRLCAPLDDLTYLSGPKKAPAARPQSRVSVRAQADDGLDLKVVGLTVDEALPLVDKALDRALLAGRPRLRVVHGIGTGRLRQAVRDYLSGHPFVASAGPDNQARGGAGVTVAQLRD